MWPSYCGIQDVIASDGACVFHPLLSSEVLVALLSMYCMGIYDVDHTHHLFPPSMHCSEKVPLLETKSLQESFPGSLSCE